MSKIQYPIEVTNIKSSPLYRNHNKPDGLFGGGCSIGFNRKKDLFQPFVIDGVLVRDIPLLLDEQQINEARIILKKVDFSKMDTEFFIMVATGGFRIAMKDPMGG